MGVVSKVLRAGEGRKVRALKALVPEIGSFEPEFKKLSDEALRAKTPEFRLRFDRGEPLEDMLVEAFAVVREASSRVLGQRHYDVQLMGGAALHFGWIAEMKTGEGKTLVSTLPVYLNGLTGRGVHLVTVNDYLARFHAQWMGQLHQWLGLSVGLVVPDVQDPVFKRQAYGSDITYGTNTELGFDYLRDNMARNRESMVQRGHAYAIVDEVDSILIDEARTPLIISGPAQEAARLYYQFASIVRTLTRDADYEVDEKRRTVAPTEDGISKVESALGVENLYDLGGTNNVQQLMNALKAKELFHPDKEYVVEDGEIKIVDEFTGRILDGRRWSDGLHQAVEAKERVRIKEENHTWATVTLQNYFRLYEKLAGMTGTAETEASEFYTTYGLSVVPIPTHSDLLRLDQPDLVYRTEAEKFEAAADEIGERFSAGQPVLVGTASVERSEHLGRMLNKRGIPHNVLNAKQHASEALIIAQAGRKHAVTVATNMAGRGVDILLGGNADLLARQEVIAGGLDPDSEEGLAKQAQLLPGIEANCKREGNEIREVGGLYVLGSERHESRRIDNQLRGRSGRQGDPGESRFFLSLEDELMRLFATGAMNFVMAKAMPQGEPIQAKMVTKAVERAQNTVESRNAEIRRDVLKYDEVMNEQRKAIYRERARVIDGADLRTHTLEVLQGAVEGITEGATADTDAEDWDIDAMLAEISTYFPSEMTPAEVLSIGDPQKLIEAFYDEGIAYFEKREQTIVGGPDSMRQLERNIMLRIVDGKWREHLAEMDYLREGINLRAMGQQDPLVAWQREGFSMFQQLLGSIQNDYVRFVLRAEVVTQEQADQDAAAYSAPADDGTGNEASAAVPAARVPGAASAPSVPTPARRLPLPTLGQAAQPASAQSSSSAAGATPAGVGPAPRPGMSRQQRRATERDELKKRRRNTE